MGSKGIDWDKQPLGKMIDRVLAKKLKCHPLTVLNARKLRKISPYRLRKPPNMSRSGINWDKQPLGKMSDVSLAKKLSCSSATVYNVRKLRKIPTYKVGIDWDQQPLGKMSDVSLAKKLSCATSTVNLARRLLKISHYKVGIGIDWDKQPLGKMSDISLAKKLSCSSSTVNLARNNRKIPPYNVRYILVEVELVGTSNPCQKTSFKAKASTSAP